MRKIARAALSSDTGLAPQAPRAPIWILVANTIACGLAIIPAFMVQMASVMGGAAPGAGELGALIAIAGLFMPFVPMVSIVGSWLALKLPRVSLAFVALPWLYAAILGIAVTFLFME